MSSWPGLGASSMDGPAIGVAATSMRPATIAQQLPGCRDNVTTREVSPDHRPRRCRSSTRARKIPTPNHPRYAGNHCAG